MLNNHSNNFTALHQFLKTLSWLPEDYELRPLEQKSSNQVFELVCHAVGEDGETDSHYLVKCLTQTEFMPLDRQNAFHIQQQLAELQFAPQPLALSNDHRYQVEQWLPRSNDMSRAALIDKIGAVMADIHHLGSQDMFKDCPKLTLDAHWQMYLQKLTSVSDDMLKKRVQFQQQIEQLTPIWRTTTCEYLCHHDLAFQHIAGLESDVIYDWEYATLGCRYFDLANAILINELNMAEQCQLLQRYMLRAHESPQDKKLTLDELFSGVKTMLPLAVLTNDLWWAVYQHHGQSK